MPEERPQRPALQISQAELDAAYAMADGDDAPMFIFAGCANVADGVELFLKAAERVRENNRVILVRTKDGWDVV